MVILIIIRKDGVSVVVDGSPLKVTKSDIHPKRRTNMFLFFLGGDTPLVAKLAKAELATEAIIFVAVIMLLLGYS